MHPCEYFKYIEYHINLLVILFIILRRFMIYKRKLKEDSKGNIYLNLDIRKLILRDNGIITNSNTQQIKSFNISICNFFTRVFMNIYTSLTYQKQCETHYNTV